MELPNILVDDEFIETQNLENKRISIEAFEILRIKNFSEL